MFYYQILKADRQTANVYYQKLINLGKEKYYEDFILGSIFLNDFDSAYDALDRLMKTDNIQVMKDVFHELEYYDKFEKLNKREVKYDLANRILQINNDILYHAYIAEHHYLKGDLSAFKRCVHTILGSSNVEVVSKAYNIFKKNVFLRLNDISLEVEFVTEAEKLGNSKATTVLQKSFKRGLLGGWKHTRNWAHYDL